MKVSVIMAVYNAGKFLKPAIDSILNQTFTDWELIAVDDCSTDNSLEILHSYDDPRIKIIQKNSNSGAAESRNQAIRTAQGEYLAIMDADDLSFPARLEKQVDFLDNHSNISVVGSYAEAIDENDKKLFDVSLPRDPKSLKTRLLFESAMIQSSAMCRSDIFELYNLYYNKEYTYVEDFEFFQRASKFVNIANVAEVLVAYRYSPGNISTRYYKEQSLLAIKAIRTHYNDLQIQFTDIQLDILYSLLYDFHPLSRKERIEYEQLFYSIYTYCKNTNLYSESILREYFVRLHKLACAGPLGYVRIIFSLSDLFVLLMPKLSEKGRSAFAFAVFFKISVLHEVFQKLKRLR